MRAGERDTLELMIKLIAIVLAVQVGVSAGGVAVAGDSSQPKMYRLYWPVLNLAKDKGERIESVRVLMSCGRFRGVTAIPNDWSLEIVSPSSEQTKLHGSAGHGATTLWNLRQFDGAILISIEDRSCFDISAEVTTTENRRLSFGRTELHLKP
jgi:hypothetical protein